MNMVTFDLQLKNTMNTDLWNINSGKEIAGKIAQKLR
jgi:hypothetical protein